MLWRIRRERGHALDAVVGVDLHGGVASPLTRAVGEDVIKPGREADFERIAQELYSASHGGEEQLLRYEYWRGADERSYYTLLSFADHQAFIAHQTSDHHETAGPHLREVMETIRLEFVDPIDGASPLPPTNEQEAPPEANELVSSYTSRFAAAVADWWHPLR